MRLSPLFLAALLLLGGTQSVLAQPNTLNEAEKLSGWELLFDGKTTDGWRNFKKDSINQIGRASCRDRVLVKV